MGLPCLTVYLSLVLVRGCFVLLLFTVLVIILLCCVWEHFGNSTGHAPGLADGRGIATIPVLLH